MKLLVSVASADEAREAVSGGADIVDAKDPFTGRLGAVGIDVLTAIVSRCGGSTTISAALGDAGDEIAVERDGCAYTQAGAQYVKLGFAGVRDPSRVSALVAAAVRGSAARRGRVIAAAYADAERAGTLPPDRLLDCAAHAGATGVLLDTADKRGAGLLDLIDRVTLAQWVDEAHRRGLLVALAGRLGAADLSLVRELGCDIAGVRGAACEGGRTGRVVRARVRALQAACRQTVSCGA